MKRETLSLVIDFLALCCGFTLICGIVNPWVLIVSFIFGCAAAVLALFKDR